MWLSYRDYSPLRKDLPETVSMEILIFRVRYVYIKYRTIRSTERGIVVVSQSAPAPARDDRSLLPFAFYLYRSFFESNFRDTHETVPLPASF